MRLANLPAPKKVGNTPAQNYWRDGSRIAAIAAFNAVAGFSAVIGLSLSVCAQTTYAPQLPSHAPKTAHPPLIDREMQKAIIDAIPRPSFDTTPVILKVRNATYRIPRNYLSDLSSIPVVKVTVPGPGFTVPAFQPLTEANQACFGSLQRGWDAGCQSDEFILGSGKTGLSAEKQFEWAMQHVANKTPLQGPFGYEFYDNGVDKLSKDEKLAPVPRHQYYAKYHNDHMVFFECLIDYKLIGSETTKHIIFCEDNFKLYDGTFVLLRTSEGQLGYIPEIEDAIRKLMASFKIEGQNQ
ncbi:hypothetical protein [Methylosinus sporium]|uniref:hypothetical protein n=1 Tax=Methylosinus sporium TaxID=428 RepID=UPI00383B8094